MANRTGPTSLDELVASPFARLAALLDGIEPGAPPIDLSLGEPRALIPSFLGPILERHLSEFGKYPPIRGIPGLREAIASWLGRRYPALAGRIDAETQVLPLNGSREGLFSAIFPALARKEPVKRPAVLIPNPFYQAYAAAAAASGAEPIFLESDAATQYLPRSTASTRRCCERTVALYLCSPSNPQGAVADRGYLAAAIALARRFDFMLFADECYSEIYSDAPPPGALETALAADGSFANVAIFNSLSKRSGLPGLRSGFVAGDPAFIAPFARFRNVACPQVPLPVQHVSVAAWSDEAHVAEGRALYRANFDIADAVLKGRYGYRRPQGGFFLWLDMAAHGGGEEATKTLWKGCGVRLLPGTYLAREGASGANPGRNHVRVALVHDAPDHGRGLGAHRRHFGVGMASKRRTKERRRLLPGAVESGLRQLLFRGYGLGIVAASCLAWASLATWSIYDPSFNNATQAAPRNVLGSWGAILADLAMQSLGLAAIVLFLPLAAWGWHLALRTVPERRRARLLLWPLSVMLLAAALSALPQPKSWPLPNGLGGILGDLFMTGALFIGVLPAAAASFVAGLLFLIAGTSLLLFACGTNTSSLIALWAPRSTLPSEWANASLGAARHAASHAGATIKRGFWWRKAGGGAEEEPELEIAAPVEDAEPDPDGRIEPTFDLEPYEYDDEDEEEDETRATTSPSPTIASRAPRRRKSIPAPACSGATRPTRPPRSSCSSRSRARTREPPSATKCCRRMRGSSKACSRISASRARSPMCAPAPWSRCTSLSPRPAPNPRASSGLPTTSPVP